ncbi:MAG: hypothetical protein ACI9VR_004337 [Cognaticolwellia sp.]|jgi:hypothetical protein
MWMLLTMGARAAEPSCLWETPAEMYGDRLIRLADQEARLTTQLQGVRAESRLVIADEEAQLHTTFSDDNLEILAVLALDEDHPMALFGETIQYGSFGTLPPGAAVHILSADGDSVTVVPSSVYVGEVTFIGAARAIPCSALTPRQPSYLRGPQVPREPADETTTFDMARTFSLMPYRARRDDIRFDPKRGPMRVVLAEERGGDSRYEYHDRYGAIWTGWSSPSNLNAYNHGRGDSLGYGLSGGGFRWAADRYYECESQLPVYATRGAEVGHLKAGARVRVAEMGGKNHMRVDWLSTTLILSDLSGCTEIPPESD